MLGATIDKYCYLNVRKLPPFFSHKHRIVYSVAENVNSLDEIQHPSVREVLKYLKVDYGVSIHHDGDIPARSGMGSSSAFTAGLLKSMYALEGKIISKEELAEKTIFIEQELIKENVGSQDQTFAAHGGINQVEFCRNGEIIVSPIILTPARLGELEDSLMLFFTGISRLATEIAEEQVSKTSTNAATLHAMKAITDDAVKIIADPDTPLTEFGALLNETWRMKKQLSAKITTAWIDQQYSIAMNAGAVGGKLLGAGGGGFLLFFVPPAKQAKVKKALNGLLQVPFRFDFHGSQIMVYQPNS